MYLWYAALYWWWHGTSATTVRILWRYVNVSMLDAGASECERERCVWPRWPVAVLKAVVHTYIHREWLTADAEMAWKESSIRSTCRSSTEAVRLRRATPSGPFSDAAIIHYRRARWRRSADKIATSITGHCRVWRSLHTLNSNRVESRRAGRRPAHGAAVAAGLLSAAATRAPRANPTFGNCRRPC